jgi:hypothetical protein
MKHIMRILVLAVLAPSLGFGGVAWASGKPRSNVLELGKKGIVTFRTQSKVGDLTLLPGRYLVQHHTDGPEHFLRFRLLNPVRHDPFSERGGKVRCSLEYLKGKVSQTGAVLSEEDDVYRVIKLRVKGEYVAHVF